MKTFEITDDRPTPLPTLENFIKRFLSAVGDPDEKVQAGLAKKMGFGFRQGIGEIIYAMATCRPEIVFAVVKLMQFSACPSEMHYHAASPLYQVSTKDESGRYLLLENSSARGLGGCTPPHYPQQRRGSRRCHIPST